ncbi:6-phosphogluconolactonase [Xylella fastidiosa subsp. pauca]|uniref:6-phosphogluconolactonase n=1 Tax=Xylella fastidiosa TaxID=2371 RepID=UPI0005839AE8|nr:6-phosphogluconolactonase [Xylella fastidiosa]ARO69200.1 6-phosphogluconolactonase [Xylella fastidiosa subsp. pauca]AVI21234.1 6-phosphogluconolactonase [Xylella fastidiosa]AVI23255.1 6-phosphogluconolactonase [Xylella fastidiosa]KIA58432.1 6-phosphogluconolactonase [Xylella fastidiosa]KXB11484.1 6-phosphogluconolactonase [Xylella fastidiosa]
MIPPNDARITLMNYDDPLEWAQSVTRELENILLQEITQRGRASLLLSGGTTPARVYETLATRPLDWSKIDIGLVDERWLSPQDKDSNAWLVRHTLLEHAKHATFLPLIRPGKTLNQCVHDANLQITHSPPPCAVVLGMGNDGHTASLFPGSLDLPKAISTPQPYVALDATGCPGAGVWPLRITLTPAGLSNIPHRLLLLRGKQKLKVLETALSCKDALDYPIRTAIDLPNARLRVHWCA